MHIKGLIREGVSRSRNGPGRHRILNGRQKGPERCYAFGRAMSASLRHDWSLTEVRALYDLPLFELLDHARAVHLEHHPKTEVQLCTLLSVKTGGCPEDCAYCPQSSHYETEVGAEKMLDVDEVLAAATAREGDGSTRFCMGAAWREVKDGPAFDRVLDDGARREGPRPRGLRDARDAHRGAGRRSSRRPGSTRTTTTSTRVAQHYRSIISTRTYDDRLRTLDERARRGHHGVLGRHHRHGREHRRPLRDAAHAREPRSAAGERARSTRSCAIEGTPLGHLPPVDPLDLVRMIAVARILMPKARVRLSAGRTDALARGAAPVPVRRRELDLLRRQAAHDAEPRRRRDSELLIRAAGLTADAPRPPPSECCRVATAPFRVADADRSDEAPAAKTATSGPARRRAAGILGERSAGKRSSVTNRSVVSDAQSPPGTSPRSRRPRESGIRPTRGRRGPRGPERRSSNAGRR